VLSLGAVRINLGKLASLSRLGAPNGDLSARKNFPSQALHLEAIFSDINASSFQSTNILYSYAIIILIQDFKVS
jgi:hypothetical protein